MSACTAGEFRAAVLKAAALLRAGQVVALPTETVYGLAANALDAQAVARIYEAKGRPGHNPIIVHVSSMEMARECCRSWPQIAQKMADAFWPGPLTMVLPGAANIPPVVTAGGETVGLRWPAHEFMQAVIRECGFPLAAPSANPSNGISPTTADHVAKGLGGRIPLIIDGGASHIGIESTVVDLTTGTILRPGMIHEESIEAVWRTVPARPVPHTKQAGGPLRSPGMLKKHYAPKARLLVLSWKDESDLNRQISSHSVDASLCHIIAHSHIPACCEGVKISVIPHQAAAFARAIYSELHRCDEEGAKWIIVEAPPALPEWKGVVDRLQRASA